MTLNRMKPFGKIAGDMFIPEGCDRPAHYEQDGHFFDAHGRRIEAGVAASIVPIEDIDDGDDPQITVADLIRRAETMNWRKFRSAAQRVLGANCPGTKVAIIEALHAVQKEFDARAAKKARERGQPVPVPAPTSGVDLGAWARGQREYLWGEVRKAIKTEFGRNVSERDDAVGFLVERGVVTAGEARRDVLREAS